MPVIARFYGMIAKMYLLGSEHNPPHIHFLYGDYNAVIDLQTLTIKEGDLPVKAASMALEWTAKYKTELLEMWNTQIFVKLPPLE